MSSSASESGPSTPSSRSTDSPHSTASTWDEDPSAASTSTYAPPFLLHGSPYTGYSSSSSVGAASPAIWFSPAMPSSPIPSDRKGKGKALDVDQIWRTCHSASSSRSSTRSKRLSVDLEGGEVRGLGFDMMGEDDAGMMSDNERTPKAPSQPQVKATLWKPTYPLATSIPDHIPSSISRLTRRRVTPTSSLPITAPTLSRSFSEESSTSHSLPPADVTTRLRQASRPDRAKRRKAGTETTVLGLCSCLGALILLAWVCTGSHRSEGGIRSSRWRIFSGGGLLSHRPPRARSSDKLVNQSGLDRWTKRSGAIQRVEATPRDTLVLYRILGNDLPPRHTRGQTIRNVRFMLEHEHDFTLPSPFTRIEKYYVLNRISSADTLSSLYALFDEYDVPADHILDLPFEWNEYAATTLRWDGGIADYPAVWNLQRPDYDPPSPFVHANASADASGESRKRSEAMGRLRAIDYTFHDKNQYAINNNGGRNYALAHGRQLPHARWILPLDGNCFFTPSAMQQLALSLSTSTQPHVVIPMARLLDNSAILPDNFALSPDVPLASAPEAPEEPQIGFRYDAVDSYQSAMRYGRRSKLELLWRLGAVPRSRALDRRTLPWETNDRQILTSVAYGSINSGYTTAGWVFRLFSGDSRQEKSSAEANALRNMNRVKGIVAFLERLDEVIVRGRRCDGAGCGFSKDRFWSFEAGEVADLVTGYGMGRHDAIERVTRVVERARAGAESLVDIATMALAGHLSNDGALTLSAARLLRKHYFSYSAPAGPQLSAAVTGDGQGYTFPLPSTTFDQPLWLRSPSPSAPWSTTIDVPLLLDTLRLLSQPHLPRSLRRPIRDLLPPTLLQAEVSSQLAHLLFVATPALSLAEGARVDLAVAAMAAYVDDVPLLSRIAARAPLRLKRGETPLEAHVKLARGLRNVRFLAREEVVEVDGRTFSSDVAVTDSLLS